jgi:tetratricopeptide (TPR) repeat protein
LESPAKHASLALERTVAALRIDGSSADADAVLSEVLAARSLLYVTMLKALQEARSLAVALQSAPSLRKAVSCHPDLLLGLETLVLHGAEADESVHFQAGLYLSHAAVGASRVAPFFGHATAEPALVLDSWGSYVPETIAKAEQLLLHGQPTSPQSVEIARRLFEHAQQFLTNVDSVAMTAENRYRAAARFAADGLRPKLAAQMLSRLAYFLALRGRHADALATADEALAHADDPLAAHLRATLRRSMGELRTSDEVHEAIGLLERAEGHLPPLGQLEEQRAAVHAELVHWGSIASGGLRACFTELADVALVLMCVFCRVVYG